MVISSTRVDVPPWLPAHFIGGHPALDLVNTVSHRHQPDAAIDRMNGVDKIAAWCAEQGILTPPGPDTLAARCAGTTEAQALIGGVARVRGHAERIFDAVADDAMPPSAAVAAVLAASADPRVVLAEVPKDGQQASRVTLLDIDADTVVAALALLVMDGVFRLPYERVRSCPRCGWLFRDVSRSGRRRWCSMQECGNREKVSRHYHSRQT